ncbi:MAG: hypothetical protein WBF81_02245 [Thermoplasmata archaeon]
MQYVRVHRWLFWGGVLLLVASIVVTTIYGPALNPPTGAGFDPTPALLIVAILLLLGSVYGGMSADTAHSSSTAETTTDTR